MKCSECGQSYHLGDCAGIADNTFTTMGVTKRANWRCRTCRLKNRSSGEGCVAGAPNADHSVLLGHIAEISTKLELLSGLKTSVEQLSQLPMKVDGLLSLRPTVESMKETVNSMQESVQFFSDKYDSLLGLMASQQKEVKELRVEVDTLQSTVDCQAQSLQRLQRDLNDMEQYGRRPNMEIHGLPFSPAENLVVALKDLAGKIGLSDFQPSDIAAVHRLPSKPDSTPPVLVRFVSVRAKEAWMSTRVKLHSLPVLPSHGRMYFNDNLTLANKDLFWRARSRGREKGYRFVWLKNCKVLARKCEGSPIVRINCPHDLESIV